jgi:RimJ/RimL family protein N-acetyltransferase
MQPGIRLAPLSASDLEDVFPLWSDFETVQHTNWTHTPTHDECVQRLARVIAFYAAEPGHIGPFAVRLDGQGFVGLAGADLRDAASATHEVWYALRREVWGRGVGGRVLAALLDAVQERGGVRRLTATAVTSNVASWHLLEKHGFHRLGILPGGHTKHGLTLDVYSYARDLAPPLGA